MHPFTLTTEPLQIAAFGWVSFQNTSPCSSRPHTLNAAFLTPESKTCNADSAHSQQAASFSNTFDSALLAWYNRGNNICPTLAKGSKWQNGNFLWKSKMCLSFLSRQWNIMTSYINPFRTKTPKYLFPRGNEPLLYHQIGNRHFFIFITNQ